MKRRMLSIITALALCLTLFPATALAAALAEEPTYTVASQAEFEAALKNAEPNDIIQLSGTIVLQNPAGTNDALVIDKAVTIQGGTLVVRYSGIILGADVTFDNIALQFPSRSRNAILANGYTLTLNNVRRDGAGQQIHLFCGGITGSGQDLPDMGERGTIIIQGNTSLGNLYAGSISSDGEANEFDKPATITIDDSANGSLGSIYASGALETPAGDDRFDPAEVAPPTPSADGFPVTGDVTIQLYEEVALQVDGATGGSRNATVKFNGERYRIDGVVLTNIAALDMESGHLVPGEGSSFSGTGASVSVDANAVLGLNNFGNIAIGDFSGGGDLILAGDQTLTITGTVSGSTKVGIGDIQENQSTGEVKAGHAYIQAANSDGGNFTLVPPADDTSMELVYDEVYGAWTAAAASTESDQILVERFELAPAAVTSDTSVDLPLNPTFAANSAALSYMQFIPLEITVNGDTATCEKEEYGGYSYTVGELPLLVGENTLSLYGLDPNTTDTYEYEITVTVPGDYSASGEALTSYATLTVVEAGGEDIEIPVPKAIPGLQYTGGKQTGVLAGVGYYFENNTNTGTDASSYDAIAKLANGYAWEDDSPDPVAISWSIGKAAGPAAPTWLRGVAPSTVGGNGRITGTTTSRSIPAPATSRTRRSAARARPPAWPPGPTMSGSSQLILRTMRRGRPQRSLSRETSPSPPSR